MDFYFLSYEELKLIEDTFANLMKFFWHKSDRTRNKKYFKSNIKTSKAF